MPATTKDGKSRIVVSLSSGSGVVVTRGTVHYVVTEYGVAYLHGKSVQDRTLALVSIAHPDHREQLLKQAIEAAITRWMGWTVGLQTSKQYGIPKGLPYLTGFVIHCEVADEAIETMAA